MKNLFSKNSKCALILIIAIFSNVIYLNAQNAAYKKNSICLSYGNIIFSDQISFSYERMVWGVDNMRTKAKINYGHYLNNNADYETGATVYKNHLSLSGIQLIGLLELNAGIAFTQFTLASGFSPVPAIDYSKIKNKITFYGNIGIRYVSNKFLIRAGIGNLELLYAGIGVNF